MAVSVLIIEDNPSALEALKEKLTDNNFEILEPAGTLNDGETKIFENHPSLLFIDVELPDGNGIEFWESLRRRISWNMYVIFYTSYDKYVINALRSQAHDYLIKPVVKLDIDEAMKRFYQHCAEKIEEENKNRIKDESNVNTSTLFVLDPKGSRVAIKISNIGYFRYLQDRKLWEVNSVDGNKFLLRHHITSAQLMNLGSCFEQVHRSFVVNVNYVLRVDSTHVFLAPPFENVDDIMISKLYRNSLFEHFCQI